MLQLHIPPPLLTLPTLNPESLAALTYLQCAAPEQFIAVYSRDVEALPLLVDGEKRVRGFERILQYLEEEWDAPKGYGSLDARLDERQRREVFVLSTHIKTHAPPLIDVHLFTDYHNYHNHTLNDYRHVLPFPARHTLASQHRTVAFRRTAALGLTAPDPTFSDESEENQPSDIQDRMGRIASTSPSLLFRTRGRGTLEMLKKQNAEQHFRIEAQLQELLEPISERLRKNNGALFQDQSQSRSDISVITSTDCLLFGYLGFLLYSLVDVEIIPDALRDQYKDVVQYVDKIGHEVFGMDFTNANLRRKVWDRDRFMNATILDETIEPNHLDDIPFYIATAPEAPSLLRSPGRLLSVVFSSLVTRLNPIPHTYRALIIQQSQHDSSFPYILGASVSAIVAILGGVITGFLATGKNGELHKVFFRELSKNSGGSRLSTLGEAGAMLGALGGGGAR